MIMIEACQSIDRKNTYYNSRPDWQKKDDSFPAELARSCAKLCRKHGIDIRDTKAPQVAKDAIWDELRNM